jgi:hypothetical protein
VVSLLDERANLAGKVALVVGGAGAIGRAVSLDLARCGVRPAVCDLDSDALAALDADLDRAGATYLTKAFDALDPDMLAGFFADFDQAFDRLDILINVVGGSTWASDLARYVTGTTVRPDGGTWAASGWLNWPGVGFLPSPPASFLEPRRMDP